MSTITLDNLLENGVHYGHRASRWNPKMKPFIHGKRNQIHIIDLRATVRGLLRARAFLQATAAEGGRVLWVGTKRSAKEAVRNIAAQTSQPFVTERWLGGSLTNFKTVRSRLGRLDELEGLEADGTVALLSKKQQSRHRIEKKKILKNLEGLRDMNELPACLVIVDPKHEHIAVAEANKMRIPVIAILDTDCDPDSVDITIPGNDDAMRSVATLLGILGEAVAEGWKSFAVILAERERVEEARRRDQQAKREADLQRQRVTEDWQRKLREEAGRKRSTAKPDDPAAAEDAPAEASTETAVADAPPADEAPAAEAPAEPTTPDAPAEGEGEGDAKSS
ncbi:MAG: 30S ribosomal protein S2 [Planctomycetota bacterium]|nr:30S ribosomal protein S2 [Planctomycetota bacterium]